MTTGRLLRPRLLHPGLVMPMFEYAPAPESRASSALRESYGLFIGGEFVDPADGEPLQDRSPRPPRRCWPRSPRPAGRRGPGGHGRPQGVRADLVGHAGQGTGQVPVPDRPDHPGALARAGRAGVARQRQADPRVPRRRHAAGRRALLLLRRLGRQAGLRRASARDPRPLGVAGQVIPWNFPLLMLAWKIAPALACGQHGGAQARRDHPADRAAVRRDLPAGRPAARRGQHRHRRRRHRPRAGRATRASTRSRSPAPPRSAGRSPARRRHAQEVTLELGGKAANIVFDDAPIDQAVEGIVNGIFFNQGHVCCAGSRLLVQESVDDQVLASLKRRLATLRLGDPLDKNTDVGAINSPPSWPRSASCPRRGRPRAPSAGRRRASCPARGLLVPADDLHRGRPRRTGSPARRSSARCCPC